MKTNLLPDYHAMLFMILLIIAGCAEEQQSPVLPKTTFPSVPVLKNPLTAPSLNLLKEHAIEVVEVFLWDPVKYAAYFPIQYLIEMHHDKNFPPYEPGTDKTGPMIIADAVSGSVAISVEAFNTGMIHLGLPLYEESIVYLRVRSLATNSDGGVLEAYSNVIQRSATPYLDNNCGNFCTISIIGDATAGGWDVDTDLRLADYRYKGDKFNWTKTVFLKGGKKVKFRAAHDWTDQWGGSTFEGGAAIKNGPDIIVPADGYYKVTFNDDTGTYSFTAVSTPVFTSIGIIGDATPGGWDSDTDLTKDPENPHLWTGTFTLIYDGGMKFRAENAWTNSWSGYEFPSGVGFAVGFAEGPNIWITGYNDAYFVWFNDITAEYALMSTLHSKPYATVGIIGPAQAGGWDSDTDMIQDPTNPYLWSQVIFLNKGASLKFRADDNWDVDWGGEAFMISSGNYFVTFNTGTGEGSFLQLN
jgi:hypothetical protein